MGRHMLVRPQQIMVWIIRISQVRSKAGNMPRIAVATVATGAGGCCIHDFDRLGGCPESAGRGRCFPEVLENVTPCTSTIL